MTRTGSADRRLDAVLAAAGASAHPDEHDEAALGAVLAAFNAAGPTDADESDEPTSAADGYAERNVRISSVRRRARWSASAAVLFIVAGSGVAVADAGLLPRPIQSLAHHVFGGIGVPAPSHDPGTDRGHTPGIGSDVSLLASATSIPQTSAIASGSAIASTGTGASPAASVQGTTTLVGLCGQVAADGSGWKKDVSSQDLATLISAAGKEKKVVSYCAGLLATAQSQQSSAAASASASATQGNGNGNGKSKGHKKATPSASPTSASG